jgi:cytochrome c556
MHRPRLPSLLRLAALAIAAAGTLLLASCGGSPADTHPGQPVTKRKLAFKQMLRSFEPMGLIVRGRKDYDRQEFLDFATELQQLADKPWQYFTPGSDYPPTRAKATVWQQPDHFRAAREKLTDAVSHLTAVARDGNLETIRPAFAQVEKSCQSCHREFRGGLL